MARFWDWLGSCLNIHFDHSSTLNVLNVLKGSWTKFVSLVLQSAIFHIIDAIRFKRKLAVLRMSKFLISIS